MLRSIAIRKRVIDRVNHTAQSASAGFGQIDQSVTVNTSSVSLRQSRWLKPKLIEGLHRRKNDGIKSFSADSDKCGGSSHMEVCIDSARLSYRRDSNTKEVTMNVKGRLEGIYNATKVDPGELKQSILNIDTSVGTWLRGRFTTV